MDVNSAACLENVAILLTISRYIESEDFQHFGIVSRNYLKAFDIVRIYRKVFYHCDGLPSTFRFLYWMKVCKVSQRLRVSYPIPLVNEYCLQPSRIKHIVKRQLRENGIEGEIFRDVIRTFSTETLFASENLGRDQLAYVLLALTELHPDVGYCQGMNYVAGAFLLILNEKHSKKAESLTFWMMTNLIENYSFNNLWKSGMPLLKLRIYQLDSLFSNLFPDLRMHLRSLGLAIDFFATQWFMTLFAKTLPLNLLQHFWDAFFIDGWKIVFRLSLVLLDMMRKDLCKMDLEQASIYLRRYPRGHIDKIHYSELYFMMKKFKVTRSILTKLEEDHTVQTLHARLYPSIDHTHMEENDIFINLDRIRNELVGMDNRLSDDFSVLRNKIEVTDKEIAHCREYYFKISKEFYGITRRVDELKSKKQILSRQLLEYFDSKRHFLEGSQSIKSSEIVVEDTKVTKKYIEEEKNHYLYDNLKNNINIMNYHQSDSDQCLISMEESMNALGTSIVETASSNGETTCSEDDTVNSGRLMMCFDRIYKLPLAITNYRATNAYPAEFHQLQQSIEIVDRHLNQAKQHLKKTKEEYLLAQVALEEYIDVKKCIAEQLLHLIRKNNSMKTERMKKLFDELDKENHI